MVWIERTDLGSAIYRKATARGLDVHPASGFTGASSSSRASRNTKMMGTKADRDQAIEIVARLQWEATYGSSAPAGRTTGLREVSADLVILVLDTQPAGSERDRARPLAGRGCRGGGAAEKRQAPSDERVTALITRGPGRSNGDDRLASHWRGSCRDVEFDHRANRMSLTPRRHHRRSNDALPRTIGDETAVTVLALQLGQADTPNAEASTLSVQYRRAASCPSVRNSR